MSERRLGAWDCEYCDRTKIWGNVFRCPGCGNPRSKGVRFYLPADAPLVTPEIAEQLGSGDPNWYCEHCQSGNIDTKDNCWNCGAPKGSSPEHEVRDFLQGQTPRSTEEAQAADPDGRSWVEVGDRTGQPAMAPSQRGKAKPLQNGWISSARSPTGYFHQIRSATSSGNKGTYSWIALGVVGAILIALISYNLFFKPHLETAEVRSFQWEQSIVLQEFATVRQSAWSGTPQGAYNIASDYRDTGRDRKVHDGWKTVSYTDTCYRSESYTDTCTRSVYNPRTCTGQRNNGDGSFSSYSYECGSSSTETYSCSKTRTVPYSCTKTRQEELYHYEDIWDNWYEYDLDQWVTRDTHPTQGNNHRPYFQEVNLQNPYLGGNPILGQQKLIQIPGSYSITFVCSNTKVGEEGLFAREYPLADWSRFEEGVKYPIEVNYFGELLSYPQPPP